MSVPIPSQDDTVEIENSSAGHGYDYEEQGDSLATHIAIPKLPSTMRDTKGRASM